MVTSLIIFIRNSSSCTSHLLEQHFVAAGSWTNTYDAPCLTDLAIQIEASGEEGGQPHGVQHGATWGISLPELESYFQALGWAALSLQVGVSIPLYLPFGK